MEPSSSLQSASFPLPSDTTTVAVLTQDELRHKRLVKLGVVAQEKNTADPALPQRRSTEHVDQQQQSRKRRAVEFKAAPITNAVIDLCDDSSDDDDDGAALKQATETTAARPLVLALDSSEEEDDDPEEKRRAQKRVANPYSTSTAKSQSTGKAKSSTAFQEPSSRSKPFHWQVATYNVWFGPNQGGDPHPDERMSALCRELLQSSESTSTTQQQPPLLFCGFQEVVPSLNVPIQRAMQASGYKVFSQPGQQYGCALAVKCRGPGAVTVLDAGWQGFTETIMGRGFLHVRARLPPMTGASSDSTEQQVLFTTTHLESWAGKDHTGKVQRAKQLQEMEAFCNQQLALYPNLQAAIITGDLNWDDERKNPTDAVMSEVLRTEWKDAWSETKQPKDTCYTYDGKMNPMLGNNLRRRFDRVLIRCRENKNKQLFDPPLVVPTTTRLLGTQAIPGLTFRKENPYSKTSREYAVAPSDHFGFVAHLQSNNF
jgi:hypothetical protein